MFRFLAVLLVAGTSLTSHSGPAEDGASAEQAGRHREALGHYVKALEAASPGAEEQRLRERIIDVVKHIRPAPAVPPEAQRRLARAQGAIELAKQPQDYQRAADELRLALQIAPWWAEGYYNLGAVFEKAEKYADSIASLKLYARASEPKEAQAAELAIARLEMKAELSSPAAKAQQDQAEFARFLRSLEGARFRGREFGPQGGNFMEVRIMNGEIVYGQWMVEPLNLPGVIDGRLLVITRSRPQTYRVERFSEFICGSSPVRLPGAFEFGRDGRTVTISSPCGADTLRRF